MGSNGKIFGVGLNKTGTMSLSTAVEILGFSSIHFVRRRLNQEMERAVLAGRPIFSSCPREIRRADAYFDIRAIEAHFDVLDGEYPGSLFILHVRDLASWLDSRERHVLRSQERYANGPHPGAWLEVNKDAWTDEWHRHHDRVRAYFADRPGDLLEIDVVAGDGWEKLAPFLGRAIPAQPFPCLNKDGHREMPRRTMAQRAKRRLKGPARRVGLL